MSGELDLVAIPAGEFLMGENANDKFANDTERPQHRVWVSAFSLGRAPVTIGEFRRFRENHEPGLPDDWPAASISWDDAQAYCQWLGDGVRLPSEAEWEYAARAGSQTPYPWGEMIDPARANYFYSEQGQRVGLGHRTPAGTYPPNRFGISDLCGNVCEWTEDTWHPSYPGAPDDGSPWVGDISNPLRVIRGGAWDYLPRLLRVSWRDAYPQFKIRDNLGFRIAR